jgi:hypothetical protein
MSNAIATASENVRWNPGSDPMSTIDGSLNTGVGYISATGNCESGKKTDNTTNGLPVRAYLTAFLQSLIVLAVTH